MEESRTDSVTPLDADEPEDRALKIGGRPSEYRKPHGFRLRLLPSTGADQLKPSPWDTATWKPLACRVQSARVHRAVTFTAGSD